MHNRVQVAPPQKQRTVPSAGAVFCVLCCAAVENISKITPRPFATIQNSKCKFGNSREQQLITINWTWSYRQKWAKDRENKKVLLDSWPPDVPSDGWLTTVVLKTIHTSERRQAADRPTMHLLSPHIQISICQVITTIWIWTRKLEIQELKEKIKESSIWRNEWVILLWQEKEWTPLTSPPCFFLLRDEEAWQAGH